MALVGALPVTAQAAQGAPTAASVISAAKTAIAKETSVHVVVASKSSSVKSSVVVDIGTKKGKETITTGTESVSIMVTSTYAYLSGNAGGLMTMMGLTAAQQKRVGTKSIAMKAGTTPYKNFKANLTFGILSAVLPTVTGTTLSSGTGANSKNYQLKWSTKTVGTSPATKSVLVISSGAKKLPVIEYISSSTGSGTTQFSNWGEGIKVPAPTSTITYTKALAK
jgi:hypothetical protein